MPAEVFVLRMGMLDSMMVLVLLCIERLIVEERSSSAR